MGCTNSKEENNTKTEASADQKPRLSGLRDWIVKKRRAFMQLVKPSDPTTPQYEGSEDSSNDIFQKPQLRQCVRKKTPDTLNQNGAGKELAIQRHHVRSVLSNPQVGVSHGCKSLHSMRGKGAIKEQSPWQPVLETNKDILLCDVIQLHKGETESDERGDVITVAKGLEALRRKAEFKRNQRVVEADLGEDWDSDEEQKEYLDGEEWQEKRKRIEEWVEVGIQEKKARELRKMMKKLKGAVKQRREEVEGGMKMGLNEQIAYLQEMVAQQEEVLSGLLWEAGREEQSVEWEDEESEEEEEMVEKSQIKDGKAEEIPRFLKMEERLKAEERQREEIKKAASAKMEKYFAARLEMRMQAVSERVRVEEERKREKVLERCRQRRMEEKRRKEEEEMEIKTEDNMGGIEEERKGLEDKQDPFTRSSFDFQDSVDELTSRKVKKTRGLDPLQNDYEKVTGKRTHVDPMEELDEAIHELLAKDESKLNTKRTSLRTRKTIMTTNTPSVQGIAPSVASRYQSGVPDVCGASPTANYGGYSSSAHLNQVTSQKRRLIRPTAAYGDRPYPPTTGRIPDSAREFFQRHRKN